MTARILVVDDIPANVKLLEVRLLAEYFEVLTATNGPDALETCENGKVDVVLLDVMMPGMDGFEVCRRLKADPATSHIPVVMITALDQVSDRVTGLEAGADDFLTKPVNDLQLMTRVKSLVRLKTLTDELRLRASTTRNIGIDELLSRKLGRRDEPAARALDRRARKLLRAHPEDAAPDRAARRRHRSACRLLPGRRDALRMRHRVDRLHRASIRCGCARNCARSTARASCRSSWSSTRARTTASSAASSSASTTILVRPIDQQELIARLRTQVRRKRYNDQLRASVTADHRDGGDRRADRPAQPPLSRQPSARRCSTAPWRGGGRCR